MQYRTIPFSLVAGDHPFLLDIDTLYAHASALTDRREPRGLRYPLPLLITLAVLAKLAGFVRRQNLADWATLRRHELQLLFETEPDTMPHHTSCSRLLGSAIDIQEFDLFVQRLLAPRALGEIPQR